MSADRLFMRRCLQLASCGRYGAPPNPMVGAVIVCEGRIIGEGYHVRCGEGHAEVNAFASVRPCDEPLLRRSTLYVSLEPCSHQGKTPPCADLIVRKGVQRVVVGCVDPFAQVQGRGIRRLREAGVEVTVGVLEAECRRLNRRFITFHAHGRPFITLKWAQTADRFIALSDGTPITISNPATRLLCHKRRAEHQAILVGTRTMQTDHPALTVRHWPGPDPRRIVLSRSNGPLPDQVRRWWDEGVQTLLVEGGRATLQAFIDADLWDEAFVETGATPLGKPGLPAPTLRHALPAAVHLWGGHTIQAFQHSN